MDYERLVLTVAGPKDLYLRQEFEAGQLPSLGLFDSNGNPLPDGNYTYELWITLRRKAEAGLPLRHSGYLAVRDGNFVSMVPPKPMEPVSRSPLKPTTAKQIISEGVCIGDLCTTGDEGGPLRLKDDFTQLIIDGDIPNIFFKDDTPGGFSADHSWYLHANQLFSSTEFFALTDAETTNKVLTVEGDAPDASLYVRSNGNVGLGTSTPAGRLDVKASATGQATERLQNTSATGFSGTEYLDNAGNVDLFFGVDNAASTTRLNSTNNNPIVVLTNSTERMRIASDGSVGIGTNSPTKRLTIKSAGGNDDVVQIVKSSGTTSIFRVFETTAGDGLLSLFDNTGAEAVRLTSVSGGRLAIGCNAPEHDLDLGNSSGTVCSAVGTRSYIDAGSSTFTTSSSRFIKENLKPVEVQNVLDRISGVKVYNYDFIEGPKDKIGLMAEDFHTLFGRGSDKMLDGQEVEMALWLAVQELTTQNRELKQELAARNEKLEKRLAELEARLAGGREDTP